MSAHVWDLTLRACPSVKVPGKTLTPGPKMQCFPAQQAAHHSLSVLFPLVYRAQPKGDSEGQQGAAYHNSPEPTSSNCRWCSINTEISVVCPGLGTPQQTVVVATITPHQSRTRRRWSKGPQCMQPSYPDQKKAKVRVILWLCQKARTIAYPSGRMLKQFS